MYPPTSFVLVALILSSGYAMVLPNNSDIIIASSWRPDIFSIPRVQYGDEDPPGDPDTIRLADNTSTMGPLLMGYYPDWAGDGFPPEKIDFSRFDWIDFAFAIPDENFTLTWDDPVYAPDLLRRVVSLAHAQDKKVKLSVGGWTGSKSVLDDITHTYRFNFCFQALFFRGCDARKQRTLCTKYHAIVSRISPGRHRHRLGISRPSRRNRESGQR